MGQAPYEVIPYASDGLTQLLSPFSDASQKTHCHYLKRYLDFLDAKTIVVENEYIDRDYLEDYAAYYARCFKRYDRRCRRLHFFSDSFDRDAFSSYLRSADSRLNAAFLQECYLGFLVTRPMPSSVIGRTCLKTYASEGGRRHFPCLTTYSCNLFGTPLIIRSLAFQEQDRAVSACATSALWSVFHKTGRIFQHSIPSPAEITRSANDRFPLESRGFPSTGLTPQQMAGAIRSIGLEPYAVRISNMQLLRNVLYAYGHMGIPSLLLFSLWNVSGSAGPVLRGRHAVTMTGYGLSGSAGSCGEIRTCRAMRMDKMYVHDDQVGPFAKMILDESTLRSSDGKTIGVSIDSAWRDCRAVPHTIIVPLYHKIRIPFEAVSQSVEEFASFLNSIASALGGQAFNELEWDIYLTDINELRADLLNEKNIQGESLEKAMTQCWPRFLWRSTLFRSGRPALDLIFDATDIEQGCFFFTAIDYDPVLSGILNQVLRMSATEAALKGTSAWQIVDWFREH